jgi:hypothetical protein
VRSIDSAKYPSSFTPGARSEERVRTQRLFLELDKPSNQGKNLNCEQYQQYQLFYLPRSSFRRRTDTLPVGVAIALAVRPKESIYICCRTCSRHHNYIYQTAFLTQYSTTYHIYTIRQQESSQNLPCLLQRQPWP